MKLKFLFGGRQVVAVELVPGGIAVHLADPDVAKPAAAPPEASPVASAAMEPTSEPSEDVTRQRPVYGASGRVGVDGDARECPGPRCRDAGAVGYYFPADGETKCGLCDERRA